MGVVSVHLSRSDGAALRTIRELLPYRVGAVEPDGFWFGRCMAHNGWCLPPGHLRICDHRSCKPLVESTYMSGRTILAECESFLEVGEMPASLQVRKPRRIYKYIRFSPSARPWWPPWLSLPHIHYMPMADGCRKRVKVVRWTRWPQILCNRQNMEPGRGLGASVDDWKRRNVGFFFRGSLSYLQVFETSCGQSWGSASFGRQWGFLCACMLVHIEPWASSRDKITLKLWTAMRRPVWNIAVF